MTSNLPIFPRIHPSLKMKGNSLNYLNIFLILLSLVVAFRVPFELFLFSYAVLGPLHYLTEISWLKKRNFFTTGKNDWIVLVTSTVLYTICQLLFEWSQSEAYGARFSEVIGEKGELFLSDALVFFIFLSLMMGIAMAAFKKTTYKLIFIAIGAAVGFAINGMPLYVMIIAIMVPTIMHVLVFTAAFMLYGALKERSISGLFTFVVFVCAACIALLFQRPDVEYMTGISDYIRSSFSASGLESLYSTIVRWFGAFDDAQQLEIFPDWIRIGAIRLIAFAYTYHYLNWFSKTSVIGWHKIPRRNLIIVFAIWVAALALYGYNYKVGLLALLFLSVLHVFLEFPLNYHSFVGIGKEGYNWVYEKSNSSLKRIKK